MLVTGWGRIAKVLSPAALCPGRPGAAVAARKEGDRAMAQALGLEALDFTALPEALGGFDFIVNTVPEQVLGEPELGRIRREGRPACWSWPPPPGALSPIGQRNWALPGPGRPGSAGALRPLHRSGADEGGHILNNKGEGENEHRKQKKTGAGPVRLLLHL
ncbi:MAG: hypothetical protein V8T45_08565 [Oscillospiraceae bacterium]